jgi:hypothetical protein
LSDSLQILPDTLRALSIRYQWSLERLVFLADSLGVPVDSAGPVMQRERFNPLATTVGTAKSFVYNTSYDVGQTQSAWRNAVDFSMGRGPFFLNNSTSVQMDRYQVVNAAANIRQTRTTATELGWKLSPSYSFGGRVAVDRLDQNLARDIGDSKNEYQLSMRSKQRPLRGMQSSLNFLTGLLDIANITQVKRGLSGNLNGQMRYNPMRWLSQEVSGTMDGNLSRSGLPETVVRQKTVDHSENIRGATSLFQAAPVSLRGQLTYRHSQVETTPDSLSVRRLLTDNSSADATLRWRIDNDRSFDMGVRTAGSKQVSPYGLPYRTTRRDDGFSATARYLLWGSAIDGSFQNAFSDAKFPTRTDSGGYGEFQHSRDASASISRPIGPRMTARLRGSIGLVSYRYTVIGKYGTPPVSNDKWRQNWQTEVRYTFSEKASTGLLLDVTQSELINIPGASTGSNKTTRSYAGEWRWSYRLLPDLTVTQRNTLGANYDDYTFLPENNRLSLDFGTETAMNAVLSPRLTINIRHNSRQSPIGSYVVLEDGLEYFAKSDETTSATLSASIVYVPSQVISLNVEPAYFTSGRTGTANGVEVQQRNSGTMNISAGATVNWPITRNGLLRGDLRRSYRAERSTSYTTTGVPQYTPRSEADFWNGSLQFSWHI